MNLKLILDKLRVKEPLVLYIGVHCGGALRSDPKITPPLISSPLSYPITSRTVYRSVDKLKKRRTTVETLILDDIERIVKRLTERYYIALNFADTLRRDLTLDAAIKERYEQPKSNCQILDDGVLQARDAKRSIHDGRTREKLAADRKATRETKKKGYYHPHQLIRRIYSGIRRKSKSWRV